MNYISNYALASYGISARRNRIWAIFNCMADGLTMITSRPVRKWAVLGYMSHLITIVSSDKTSPSTISSSSITSTLTPTSSTLGLWMIRHPKGGPFHPFNQILQGSTFVSYMGINKLLKLTSYVTQHFLFGGLVDLSIVGSVVKPGVRPALG